MPRDAMLLGPGQVRAHYLARCPWGAVSIAAIGRHVVLGAASVDRTSRGAGAPVSFMRGAAQPARSGAPRQWLASSVRGVQFSRELRDDVLAGDITLSVRLWKRPQVKQGGRYRIGPRSDRDRRRRACPFAAITEADVRRAGESDRETLR